MRYPNMTRSAVFGRFYIRFTVFGRFYIRFTVFARFQMRYAVFGKTKKFLIGLLATSIFNSAVGI